MREIIEVRRVRQLLQRIGTGQDRIDVDEGNGHKEEAKEHLPSDLTEA